MARTDVLIAESDTLAEDASTFESDWVDSSGINTVSVYQSHCGGAAFIEGSTDGVSATATYPKAISLEGDVEYAIPFAFFRVALDGAEPGTDYAFVVRSRETYTVPA
jgi:hypothetical protein